MHINFDSQKTVDAFILSYSMDNFINKDKILSNPSSQGESSLIGKDQLGQQWSDTIGQDLRNDFVHHITQANLMDMAEMRYRFSLRDKHDDCSVNSYQYEAREKNILDRSHHTTPYYILVALEKQGWHSVWTWRFGEVHILDYLKNFEFLRHNCYGIIFTTQYQWLD